MEPAPQVFEEEKKVEIVPVRRMPVDEEQTIDVSSLPKLKPMKPLMVFEPKQFEGVEEADKKEFVSNFMRRDLEEVEDELTRLKIPKCNWAYKTPPLTLAEDEDEQEFFYILPYCYATAAEDSFLESCGLLQSIELRE